MAEATSSISLGALPLVVSIDADTAVAEAADAGTSAFKRAVVLSCEVNAQAVFLLVRVQDGPNGLFVDVVADQSLAAVDTRMASLDLNGISHPSPTEDAIDTAVLVAAA